MTSKCWWKNWRLVPTINVIWLIKNPSRRFIAAAQKYFWYRGEYDIFAFSHTSSFNLFGVLWIPRRRRMCLGAWGSDWGDLITSINWTFGIGLSLKRLNDKSPFSLSPCFVWALRRALCPDPQHHNTAQASPKATFSSKHFWFYCCLDLH